LTHNRPPKARVRASFERAAATYDAAAEVQRHICEQLAAALPAGLAPGRLLDAGCGTGYARGLLEKRFPQAAYVGLDLAPAMLLRVAAPGRCLAGDLEHLPLATASIDLYWSSLAVQWCDLAATLGEARRVLRPAGRLALASLGPETFHELRHAFAGIDQFSHTLGFHSPDEIGQLAAAAGFTETTVARHRETAHYPDFGSLLRAVKAVGANQLGTDRRPGLMSRSTFRQAEAAAEALRTPAGLPLSYDVITLHARP
jgi:malonyl-CoA O-methyltransferase